MFREGKETNKDGPMKSDQGKKRVDINVART